ncbi:A-agglutinin anchorage subunit [Rhodotorula toruloides ATCC 204091]|uniref:A-agglutinin anchorage subunit n=1 Tax=Rhodotorula toruloides TaxID=5286 RepID=A0A0K3CFZ2_RHOTO|nr:A-agglutinin anchorage subunit [Rhodotorula toruloides ATCC 204091]PRQ74432.1 A-agglutinin anchorage subunit [Rhodotorula toruloides]
MAASDRLLVSRDVTVFPPQFLTVIRMLLNLKVPFWYREFEDIYQKVRGMEALADEMLERLGDKAWQPWQAFEELDRDPVLLAPYMGHANVARSSDYENIRLNPSSVYDQTPIVTKMGKVHDIAKKARELDSGPPDGERSATLLDALDRARSFTSSLLPLRSSASTGQAYESSFAPIGSSRPTSLSAPDNSPSRKAMTGLRCGRLSQYRLDALEGVRPPSLPLAALPASAWSSLVQYTEHDTLIALFLLTLGRFKASAASTLGRTSAAFLLPRSLSLASTLSAAP